MLPTQTTATDTPRQDPSRWTRAEIASVLDNFAAAETSSQRETAQRCGIPHATFNYWTRHYRPPRPTPRTSSSALLLANSSFAASLPQLLWSFSSVVPADSVSSKSSCT
jgi:hypothetical protein